jgi:exopolysaccharide biosynthesis WecB/TagA/CpsF family protein
MTDGEDTIEFLGLNFDALRQPELLARLCARPPGAPFAYLVTPNVDHMVRLHDERAVHHDALWRAYEAAAWRCCDSRILAALAKLRKQFLPVVAGSDLTQALFDQLPPGTKVAVIGGSIEMPKQLRRRYPGVEICQHRPPMGLLHDRAAMDGAADFAAACMASFTLIAVGSPQQELLAHRIASRTGATGIGLCIGASLDFLTGEQVRAPVVFQKAGLEWLFRLGSNPRRFWRRYLIDGPKIFQLWWRDRARDGAPGPTNTDG